MKETHFSIKEVLKTGWEGWKQHWGLWIAIVAISFLLGSVSNIGGLEAFKNSPIAQSLFQILGIILGSYAGLGLTNVALKVAKNESVALSDYFDTFSYFWRYLLGQILYYVAVTIGVFLLIVPGIIVALKFFLFPYFIIEKNMGVIDSFKASNKAIYGSKSNLLLFGILGMLINILGLICFGVGLFISIPIVSIAQAAIYKIVTSQIEGKDLPLVTES